MGSSIKRLHKLRATIRIDGMIASMIGHHHVLKIVALSHSCSDRQHNTIAERYYSRLHILIGIMTLRDSLIA